MSALNAFVAAASHDLFASVAAPADAAELVERDVPEGQHDARAAIRLAISNAVTARGNPGPRIALILGESGSGKTHVVTTAFGYAAHSDEVLPAVVQLSAPVSRDNYLSWLVEAIFREFCAAHHPTNEWIPTRGAQPTGAGDTSRLRLRRPGAWARRK